MFSLFILFPTVREGVRGQTLELLGRGPLLRTIHSSFDISADAV